MAEIETNTIVTVGTIRFVITATGMAIEHDYNYGNGHEWTPIGELDQRDVEQLIAVARDWMPAIRVKRH